MLGDELKSTQVRGGVFGDELTNVADPSLL